ncbi:MAG: alcohol dehydrogenase catalytic domain-containing protein [Candidatus Omnitrophica bacterium]|nr:alcohol dehydrogenase catalytic domain-containing protein [Candidatus Omnitrophota bacterium]
MRVAIYYSNGDVRIEERPSPKIGEGELLIKVVASGLCGTDVMEWYRINRVPLVLGHEIAGEIIEVGPGVKKYKKGQRIACSHHVPCGECHYCRMGHETVCETLRKTNFDPGGFSEYARLPKINVEKGVYVLPDSVSYEEATFTEPLACVLRGQRLAGIKNGQEVLVIGSGISGLLHIQMAKVNGAAKITATDINDYRLNFAKKFGADAAIRADVRGQAPAGSVPSAVPSSDLVILCAGAKSAVEQALKSVDSGGTVLFFAAAGKDQTMTIDINKMFWRNEITLTSSYAASPKEHLEALELIAKKRINVKDMITHRFGLTEAQKGFKLVAEAKESVKVIIDPQK